jgi:predicted HicB family RNase H-like nuclease
MANPEKRQQTAILYVRVKPEVKAMLTAQADAQGRSMANYLEWLVRQQNRSVPVTALPGETR